MWGFRIKQARDKHIASALVVGAGVCREREEESPVGFGVAAGGAEGVDDALEVEGVGAVAAQPEAVEEAECFVGAARGGADDVNSLSPVGCIAYIDALFFSFFFENQLLVLEIGRWLMQSY